MSQKINKHLIMLLYLFIYLYMSVTGPFFITKGLHAETRKAPQLLFLEANQAYEKGDYKTSSVLYKEMLNSGIRSGPIYYNLGNCYAKQGQIGNALLFYRKAERFIPRNGDLKFNLQYILDQRKDKIETKYRVPFAKAFFFWYFWLSLKELLVIFLVVNFLFWLFSLLLLFKQHYVLKRTMIITLCLFLIFGASLGIKTYSQKIIHYGVVIESEAMVRSGNSPNYSPLFILHEGAEFRIMEETKDWIKIRLADGKIGWVSSSAVQTI